MNTMKTAVLLAALTGLLLFIGELIGGRNGTLAALGFAALMNFGAFFWSDKIVLSMYRARPVDPTSAPELHAIVSKLAMKAGIPMPRLYVIPDAALNAFATGRSPSHAAVAATEGILRSLSQEELEGVLAHELSHVLNRDTLISTVAATLAGAISFVARLAYWVPIGGGRSSDDEGRSPLGGLLMLILAPLAAMLIQLAVSRSREYDADASGARLVGYPNGLANALRKLQAAAGQIPMHDANPSTAHLFIVNPLSGRSLMGLFSTHPPLEKRIARLMAMNH